MRRREPVEAYAKLLAREIELLGKSIGAQPVHSIHWGGGTPSMLGPELLTDLTDRIGATFDCTNIAEHAIELDPRHVDRPLVESLTRMGVTRASLGVQEFSPRVQEAIGRVQPFGQVAECVTLLREAGIANLNFDLMYGLPHQRTEDLERTVFLAHTLAPNRIALFGYAHVPWFKTHQRLIDESALAGASERLALAEGARQSLLSLGYVQIGLDHFARPDDDLAVAAANGTLRRNFQGYTTDTADALLGIGASAIGRLPQGFVQNFPDLGGYRRVIESGRFATAKGIALSDDDRVRGNIIERLMCDFAADASELDNDTFDTALDSLAPLASEAIVKIDGRYVAVTQSGRPFVRLVAAAFDAYLAHRKARHSVAV
jgi:oxygen-independent coproporphyrinogen-3 oxidase